jgi:pyridoxal phosphate enzyme (YggS family)
MKSFKVKDMKSRVLAQPNIEHTSKKPRHCLEDIRTSFAGCMSGEEDTKSNMSSGVVHALTSVRTKIELVSSRLKLAKVPRLVAVSKTKPNELLMEAYNAGQRHFGENYVQEMVTKAAELPKDINWHFIGHLQSNKCKQLLSVDNLYLVETVDSAKLATKLDSVWGEFNRENKLNVMVQVNTSNEQCKLFL